MVRIQVDYEGQLRCRATHGPSGRTLHTDAPVDNHGKGESFSPTDLLTTSLGTCMLTIMGIVAERHGWDLSGASVRLQKVMESEPVRRVARIEVDVHVPGELDERARKTLERAAHACPVAATLGERVETPTRFHWASSPVG